VKRKFLRYLIAATLVASSAFAAWSWLLPYAWAPDPAAGCEIRETLVRRDNSYYWLDVHLEISPGSSYDLQKPVVMETGAGNKLKPADVTVGSIDGKEPDEIWFKFWLEQNDLAGPLTLRINEGSLIVRSGSGSPDLGGSGYRNFTTIRW
jgi:hypothetical protein